MVASAKTTQLRYKYTSISASTAVKSSGGTLHRIIVTASSSGVITVYDSLTAANTKIIDALSVTAGNNIEINAQAGTGIYVSIDSGTARLTVVYS